MDGAKRKRVSVSEATGSSKKVSKFSDGGTGKSQAELLQEQIAMQLAAVSSQLEQAKRINDTMMGGERKPSSMMLDSDGNIVDAEGNKIQGRTEFKTVTTLKANTNEPKKKFVNPYLAHKAVEIKDKNTQVDINVRTTNHQGRKQKSLQFVKSGTYIKQADNLRFKEQRKIIAGFSSGRNARGYDQSGISKVGLGLGDVTSGGDKLDDECGPVGLALGEFEVPHRPDEDQDVPLCEWWDVSFLAKAQRPPYEAAHRAWIQGKKYKDAVHPPVKVEQLAVKNSREYPYIQHPVPIQPVTNKEAKPLQLMLTKKETKKIRRQRRAERRAFVQDQILMGLAEAPAPKMKISNMYRIMGAEGVADPSKLEAQVKEEVAQRMKNHEMRNLARKLTPAEKKEKKRKKLMEDTSNEVNVALFRVGDLTDPKHQFKVDVNAQETFLTGGVLMCKHPAHNLVVVEGGAKAIRRFSKLMIRRIDWDARVDDDKEEETFDSDDEGGDVDMGAATKTKNKCHLVWCGITSKRSFKTFRFQECHSEITARKVLEAKGVPHYWDMIVKAEKAVGFSSNVN